MPVALTVMLVLPTHSYRAGAFLAAAADLGLEVVVAANEPSSLMPHLGDRHLTLDLGRPEESADRAADLAGRRRIDAVVGVDESAVVVAAHVAARLGLRHSAVDAAAATRDKRELRRLLARHSVPQPLAVEIATTATDEELDGAAAAIGFPCVAKPVNLAASQGVIRADTPAGLRAAVDRIGRLLRRPELCGDRPAPLLVEEFAPGLEVAVEGVLDAGRLHVLAVFDKPEPLDGPFFEETFLVAPARLPASSLGAVARVTEAAVSALGLQEGPIHAELRLAPAGPRVIEVASRSIGGHCSGILRFTDGETLEAKILRQACGLPLGDLALGDGGAGALMIPIPRSGRLERIEGVASARAVPGIASVDITVPVGTTLEALPEGDRYLGFILARASTPDDVEMALRGALGALRIVITP
jgi:biotin carboxylase